MNENCSADINSELTVTVPLLSCADNDTMMENLKERKATSDKYSENSDRHHDARKQNASSPSSLSIFYQKMTTSAQAFILLYAILIITLCFSDEFVFFTWHPLLLSIGWMFLMSEGVLVLSKQNIFTGTLSKKIRLRLHWIFLGIASTSTTIGLIVVYLNKNYMNKSHFTTWHGLFGLIAFIMLIPALLDGIAALYHKDLKHIVSPRISKLVHVVSGIISLVFGSLALVLSIYTKWFERRTNGNSLIFLVGFVLVATSAVFILVRPFRTTSSFLKSFK